MSDALVALGLSIYAGNGLLLLFEELIRKHKPTTVQERNLIFDLLRQERRDQS